jgi:two-component system cell cycle sensor histidine kinase/response regulator CckA
MLAVTLAITVFFAVQAVGEVVPQAVTIGLSILSLAGLIALFGALAGFVHFGRTPRQKAFFDKLLDAVGEPCVVSDSRGAIIYSNEPYQRLVSQAGRTRLVNLETLYSGYPDVSERIYRLARPVDVVAGHRAHHLRRGIGGWPGIRHIHQRLSHWLAAGSGLFFHLVLAHTQRQRSRPAPESSTSIGDLCHGSAQNGEYS